MNSKTLGLAMALTAASHQAWSAEACRLVAQLAGSDYYTNPSLAASMTEPSRVANRFEFQPIDQVGVWHIYQTQHQAWWSACAPKTEQGIEFYPVLEMPKWGQHAVVTGTFVIKTHRAEHIGQIETRYGFQQVSYLPNRFSAVFDVNPTDDYDRVLQKLDWDKDIETAIPVLIEPPRRR